ncbi:myosin, partial [Cryptosporidium bovis]|uniref:myosin n=1 Tax=Cryptosporidium bovis TaxID=310047 RepID=UPI00351A1C42
KLELERIRKEQEEMEIKRKKEEEKKLELERIRKEQEEIERRRKEEKERELELERIRKEQEEIERKRKEEEERELELERINHEGKEGVLEDENDKPKKRNMKRVRDDEEYNDNEDLYINDCLEINKKKRATESIRSDENTTMEAISGDGANIEISKLNNSDSGNNSPLLCTSVMRGKKRYSIYYVSGNENSDHLGIEARTLQDEIVEAEFNEEVLGRENHVEYQEMGSNCGDFNNSILVGHVNMKTGIKRPTVFIHNEDINELSGEKENINGENEGVKGTVHENNSLESSSIKKSLKAVQENFRSNIIKQKEMNKQINKLL